MIFRENHHNFQKQASKIYSETGFFFFL